MSTQEECKHMWIGATREGKFIFSSPTSSMPNTIHATCEFCNARTWFTREQWEAMEEVG